MDSAKLKRVQKILNIAILCFFLALIAVVAIVVKDAFFKDIGKIFKYIYNFIFTRPWDVMTYLVLICGAGVSVLAVVWIAYNVIRKRGLYSYIAPIVLFSMVLIALVAYHYRTRFVAYVKNPEIATWTYIALLLVVDICVISVVNAIVARIADVKYDAVYLANAETTESVSVNHVEVIKEETDEKDDETREEIIVEETTNEETVEEVKAEEVKVEAPKEKKKYDTLDTSIYGEIIRRTFMEKYEGLDDSTKAKYMEIRRELLSYAGVRSRISKHCDSYRFKKEIKVKINIQGKTLKIFFALDPKAYKGTTYPIIDVSGKKVYAEVPTLLKVKSDLSVKRAKQLIADLMDENDIERLPEAPTDNDLVMRQDLDIIRRSFVEKMLKAPVELQEKYEELKSYILSYGVKARVSATSDSFRYKKELLIKMTIQGKTLKVFFAVDPRFFDGTTIPVIDVSNKKSYVEVPSLLKVKSGLSLKRAKAIVDQVMQTKNLTRGDIVQGEHVKDLKKLKKAKAK